MSNSQLWAQLVEHCTGTAYVMGFKSRTGLDFFPGFIFTTAYVVFITAKIIYDFHIFAVVTLYFKIKLMLLEQESIRYFSSVNGFPKDDSLP